jgi:hypothetical protein
MATDRCGGCGCHSERLMIGEGSRTAPRDRCMLVSCAACRTWVTVAWKDLERGSRLHELDYAVFTESDHPPCPCGRASLACEDEAEFD